MLENTVYVEIFIFQKSQAIFENIVLKQFCGNISITARYHDCQTLFFGKFWVYHYFQKFNHSKITMHGVINGVMKG